MSVLLVALAGGLLAIDNVSLGQTMVSRPLVTGAVIGAILGDPLTGMTVGAMLELYLLVAVPAGGGRYPEGSIAATVGTSAAIAVTGAAAIPVGVSMGLVVGWGAGFTQGWLREFNGRRAVLASDGPVTVGRVRSAVLGGLFFDWLRSTVLCGVGAAIALHLLPRLSVGLPLGSEMTGALILAGGMVSAGILFRNAPRRPLDWLLTALAAVAGWWIAGGPA